MKVKGQQREKIPQRMGRVVLDSAEAIILPLISGYELQRCEYRQKQIRRDAAISEASPS